MPARRKPALLHELHSTIPHDRTPDVESEVLPGWPKRPRDVDRRVFKSICKHVKALRSITPGDEQIIRLLCVVLARHEKALERLVAEGEVRSYVKQSATGDTLEIESPNLWLKVAETSERTIIACLDRLGLTPLNRSKIRPTKPPAVSTGDSMRDLYPHLYGGAQPEAKPPIEFKIPMIDEDAEEEEQHEQST